MAAKDPVQQDTEAEPVPVEAVIEQVASALPAANADQFIDGQKVTPPQAAAAAKKPLPKTPAKAATKGPHDSVSDGDEDREGFSDAYDQTFGAGAFTYKEGKEQFDMDNAGRFTNTPSAVYSASAYSYESAASGTKSDALQQTETWFGIAEAAMGGDGNPYTSDLAFDYDAHSFGDPYANRYTLTDDRDFLSQIRYEENYIDTGLGCSRYGGSFDQATRPLVETMNAWKTDSALVQEAQKATVDDETGLVYTSDGRELDPKTDPEAQRIVQAKIGLATEPEQAAPLAFKPKAELDAMAAENPLFKKPEILAKKDGATGAGAPTLAAKTDPLSITGIGQAGDFALAYQSVDQIAAGVIKDNSYTAKASGPAATDPFADLEIQKPKAQPIVAGPAPAGPAPAPG